MALRNFLAYLTFTFWLVAGQSPDDSESPKYALKGQEVNLKPGLTVHPDTILWKHNGNKVVDFDGNENREFGRYQNRITLDWHSAELTITELQFEDSGVYEMDAFMKNMLHREHFRLVVIDKVASPAISCEITDGSSSDQNATLVCSAESKQLQHLVKFTWESDGNVPTGPSGPQLTIPLGEKQDDKVYSCRASNPLTYETVSFTAKDCYPDESSSAALIASLVTIFSIILILIVLGVVFCKCRHKACFAKEGDPEKQSADHGGERKPFLEAPTLPSNQSLAQVIRSPINHHREDSDFDEDEAHVEGDTMPKPGHVQKLTKKFEPNGNSSVHEDKEKQSAPASPDTSIAQPRSPLTRSSPDIAPMEAAGEHMKVSDSEQVTGGTTEDLYRESDSSINHREKNDTDDSSEEKQPSTDTELEGSETSIHEQALKLSSEETRANEDDNQDMGEPVSEDENKSESVSDVDEIDAKLNLSSATYQPESPLTTKPDNRQTDASPASPDTAHTKPGPEEVVETRHESDESEGELESPTADTHTGFNKETNEDEEKRSAPASAKTSPIAQPRSPFTRNSPHIAPMEAAGEHTEVSDTDDSSEEKHPSTRLEDSETSIHEQDSKLSPEESVRAESDQEEESEGQPNSNTAAIYKGFNKDTNEDEEKQSAPASAETSPIAQPRSPLTRSSPDNAPMEAAGEHMKVSYSEQVTGETTEDLYRESDSSINHREMNDTDDSSEEKQPSTDTELEGSETSIHEQDSLSPEESLHAESDKGNVSDKVSRFDALPESNNEGLIRVETNRSSKNKPGFNKEANEMEQPVSKDENNSESVDIGEEIGTQHYPSLGTEQPKSPSPTKPDNRQTDASPASPDTEHTEPGPEEVVETRHESDESERELNSSTADTHTGSDKEPAKHEEAQSAPTTAPAHADLKEEED